MQAQPHQQQPENPSLSCTMQTAGRERISHLASTENSFVTAALPSAQQSQKHWNHHSTLQRCFKVSPSVPAQSLHCPQDQEGPVPWHHAAQPPNQGVSTSLTTATPHHAHMCCILTEENNTAYTYNHCSISKLLEGYQSRFGTWTSNALYYTKYTSDSQQVYKLSI